MVTAKWQLWFFSFTRIVLAALEVFLTYNDDISSSRGHQATLARVLLLRRCREVLSVFLVLLRSCLLLPVPVAKCLDALPLKIFAQCALGTLYCFGGQSLNECLRRKKTAFYPRYNVYTGPIVGKATLW